jgi:hypothetical protein
MPYRERAYRAPPPILRMIHCHHVSIALVLSARFTKGQYAPRALAASLPSAVLFGWHDRPAGGPAAKQRRRDPEWVTGESRA